MMIPKVLTDGWIALTRHRLAHMGELLKDRRRMAAIFATLCGVIFLLSLGQTAYAFLQPLAAATTGNLVKATLPHDWQGRTNVLILGVGDKEHAAANLTDTIIIASIQPHTNSISLLSIPRDLYLVDTTEVEPSRINALYAQYWALHGRHATSASGSSVLALRSTAEEIGKRMNIQIHGVVKVDFTAFENIIDSLGGVDVDVPEAITDYSFPLEEGVVGTYEIEAGPHHFNGRDALRYARSRHSTSDFDRSARQQLIIQAVLQKAREKNLFDDMRLIRPVLQSLTDHAQWTFTAPQLINLAGAVFTVPQENILRMSINGSIGGGGIPPSAGGFVTSGVGTGIASGAILIPYSLSGHASDWGQLKTITDMVLGHRKLYMEQTAFSIQADPSAAGNAIKLRNELLRYGFPVQEKIRYAAITGTGRIVMDTWAHSSDFAELTGLEPQQASTGSGIVLQVGKRYKFVPFEHRIFPSLQ